MVAGIDIGGSGIKAALVDEAGTVLDFRTSPILASADRIVSGIMTLVETMASKRSIPISKLTAIGICSAGSIDREKGIVVHSANIPSLREYPLAVAVRDLTGVRVLLENDATAATIGEGWKGLGGRYSTWILLTLGTGIGGGAVIDGRVYRGQSGIGMEAGHISIDFRGRKCPCGGTGCLELYASAAALVRFTRSSLRSCRHSSLHRRTATEPLTAKMVYEEALKGDKLSALAFRSTGTYLGIGVTSLVNIFNPQAVLFAGGLSRAHRLILPVIKKVVSERAVKGFNKAVRYIAVRDPARIAALGAAKIALESS
jgi:glucokinase